MWWLGDRQWVGSSECVGTWGVLAAGGDGKGSELFLLGEGQHRCHPAQLGWGPPGAMGALIIPPAPLAGGCTWGRATAVFSLPGGRITS